MNPGLVLSFCNKRWTDPLVLASLCRNKLSVDKVQFTWDMVNPLWSSNLRNRLAKSYAEAFRAEEIEIPVFFSGMSAYVYPGLLGETKEERKLGMDCFKKAINTAAEMSVPQVGAALGCMSDRDAQDPIKREEHYERLLEQMNELSLYAYECGIESLSVEPTPVFSEIPNTLAESLRMMNDLNGNTSVPIKLMLDIGHILCQSFEGDTHDVLCWLDGCKGHISGVHLQQCDGIMDRHWPFDCPGLITKELIYNISKHPAMFDVAQYLEYCPAFETPNDQVLHHVKASLAWLRQI